MVAHLAEPPEVIGADRLFEPGPPRLGCGTQYADRLLGAVAAVGIDEETSIGSDGGTSQVDPGQVAVLAATPVLADLDLQVL